MNKLNSVQYMQAHLADIAEPGATARRLAMALDFGLGEEPPMPPSDWLATVHERTQAIRDLVTQAQADRCAYGATKAQYQAAMATIMDTRLGPLKDLADQIDAALPNDVPAPEHPPPVEPPARVRAVFGTYSGHGLAVDAYPGLTEDAVHWGPHHGLPIVAPADGRVEVYQFGTPLALDIGAGHSDILWSQPRFEPYTRNWHALADGWVCRVDPLQAMFVCVWYPFGPFSVEDQRVGHLHWGHVRADIQAGAVRKGEHIATVWDSGVRFEPGNPVARCAHVHCCAGAGTTLSPNGDLPGRLAAVAQGWEPLTDIGFVPGPPEYQIPNQYCAGRPYQDFLNAARQPPPMPS